MKTLISAVVRLLFCLCVCGGVVSATFYEHYDYEEYSNSRGRHDGHFLRARPRDRIQSVIADTPFHERDWWPDSDSPLEDQLPRLSPRSEYQPPEPPPPPPPFVPVPDVSAGEEDLLRFEPTSEKPTTNTDSASLERLVGLVDNLQSELKAQQDKITELENVNKKLQDKVDLIEQQTKTNNLLFFNVPESRHENHKTTQQKVLQLMNKVMRVRTVAPDIAMALRVNGNFSSDRPIVVKFTNFATKMRVMASKNRLGRSDVKVEGDYSDQVNQRRSELVPYLQALRSSGHHVYLVYDKLMVDGVAKTLQELQEEEALDPTFVRRIACENPESETTTEEQHNPDEQVEEVEVETPTEDYEE